MPVYSVCTRPTAECQLNISTSVGASREGSGGTGGHPCSNRRKLLFVSQNICDSLVPKGSWFKEENCIINVVCMLEWVLKDMAVCRGQYADEAGCVKNI